MRPRVPKTTLGVRVTAVAIATPEMFTIEASSELWQLDPIRVKTMGSKAKGAFIRLEPPEDVSDDHVAGVKAMFLNAGAAAVRVSPRRKRATVTQASVSKPAPRAPREAAMQLVAQANTRDRDALKGHVETALAASGL